MCKHLRKQGDNYGETCMDCGEVLAGYGFGGRFGSNLTGHEACKHHWIKGYMGDPNEEVCMFCEAVRRYEGN